jgi:hypothetical protein
MPELGQHLLISFVPLVPFVVLATDYHRRLREKRLRVLKLLENGQTLDLYHAAFGGAGGTAKEIVDALFGSVYRRLSFLSALTLVGAAVVLLSSALVFGVPDYFRYLAELINTHRAVIAAPFAGAYIWTLTAVIAGYATDDLSPGLLHSCWLRMIAAPIVAVSVLALLPFHDGNGPKAAALAFLIAVFPVDSLQSFVRNLARNRMHGLIAEAPAQPPTLHHLQGMTERAISRLAEEGIDSAQRLAYCDPLKLIVRTNLPWVVIVDLIDQALLFGYLKEQMAKLTVMGIRGCIEVARLGQDLGPDADSNARQQAEATVGELAKLLGFEQRSALYLVQTVYEDQQVQFIWSLFTDVTPGDEQDLSSGERNAERSRAAGHAA